MRTELTPGASYAEICLFHLRRCGHSLRELRRGQAIGVGQFARLARGHQMMASNEDDEESDQGDKEEENEEPSGKRGQRNDEDDRPKKKRRGAGKTAKGGGIGLPLVLGIAAVAVLCCVCLPIGGGIAFVFVRGTQKEKDGPQAKDGPKAKDEPQAKDGPKGRDGLLTRTAQVNSTNNLKQISLAFMSFHDANKRLPFNGSGLSVGATKYSKAAVPNSMTSGSWAFQILPFIDEVPVFNTVDKNKAIATYMCPGRGRPQLEAGRGAWTDYFINGYVNSPNDPAKPDASDNKRTLVGILDGTSNTIFVGHGSIAEPDYAKTGNVTGSSNIFLGGTIGTMRSGKNAGANPTGLLLAKDSAAAPGIGSWGGPFPNGALMAMGDATVRLFPYSTANFGEFDTGGQ